MDQEPTRDAAPRMSLPAEPGGGDDAAARTVMARMVARHGAPSLAEYRRTYSAAGLDCPGGDVVRARHSVADVATAVSTRHSVA